MSVASKECPGSRLLLQARAHPLRHAAPERGRAGGRPSGPAARGAPESDASWDCEWGAGVGVASRVVASTSRHPLIAIATAAATGLLGGGAARGAASTATLQLWAPAHTCAHLSNLGSQHSTVRCQGALLLLQGGADDSGTVEEDRGAAVEAVDPPGGQLTRDTARAPLTLQLGRGMQGKLLRAGRGRCLRLHTHAILHARKTAAQEGSKPKEETRRRIASRLRVRLGK